MAQLKRKKTGTSHRHRDLKPRDRRPSTPFEPLLAWIGMTPRLSAIGRFCWKSRKSKVVANLPKYQRHLRLTLIAAADRFFGGKADSSRLVCQANLW